MAHLSVIEISPLRVTAGDGVSLPSHRINLFI